MAKINIGEVFICTRTLVFLEDDETCYFRGKIYVSQEENCITNELGDRNHQWASGNIEDGNLEEEFKEYFIKEKISVARTIMKKWLTV